MTMSTDNTLFLLSRLHQKANAFIVSELESYGHKGLKPSHGDILVTLFQLEAANMSELAKRISRDPSTVTTLVKKLGKLGYIETEVNPNDHRSHLVHLTDAGKALEGPIRTISEKLYQLFYADIKDEEREQFRKTLANILNSFD